MKDERTFQTWWKLLNLEIEKRGEPPATRGEAKLFFTMATPLSTLAVEIVHERLRAGRSVPRRMTFDMRRAHP